jgi:hypothetical protein
MKLSRGVCWDVFIPALVDESGKLRFKESGTGLKTKESGVRCMDQSKIRVQLD